MENNGQKIVSSLFWSYSERLFTQIVSLIVSIILARLLSPENYGVISIVMIFITLCDAIVDGGLGDALIQKQDADTLDINTMFFCSVGISLTLYTALFFSAPYIASFYQTELICPLLRVLGLRLLISGVNTIQRAWIQKQMLFRKFFIASSFGTILSAAAGIILAYLGAGPWALVAQYLTNSFVDTAILFFTNNWRPKLIFSFTRAKALLSYGCKVLMTTIVATLEQNLRSLIIGKQFGSSSLAYYDQGQRFPNLLVTNVNGTITNVMFPVLAQNQDDPVRFKLLFRRAIQIGTYLLTPLLIGLIAVADTFVCGILSEKWAPCIPYLRILTLMYLARPFTAICAQAILSVGYSGKNLKIMTIINTFSVVMLLYTVFVLKSVLGIAYCALATECVSFLLYSFYGKKLLCYSFREQCQDLLPSILLSGIMGILTYLIHFLPAHDLLTMILQIFFGCLFYLAASWLLQPEPYVYLIQMIGKKIQSEKMQNVLSKMVRRDVR